MAEGGSVDAYDPEDTTYCSLSSNGTSATGKSNASVDDLEWGDEEDVVTLGKNEGKLGITYEHIFLNEAEQTCEAIVIKTIKPSINVLRGRRFREMDKIVQINGQSIVGLTRGEIKGRLKAEEVTLTYNRLSKLRGENLKRSRKSRRAPGNKDLGSAGTRDSKNSSQHSTDDLEPQRAPGVPRMTSDLSKDDHRQTLWDPETQTITTSDHVYLRPVKWRSEVLFVVAVSQNGFLERGDLILAVNGAPLQSKKDLERLETIHAQRRPVRYTFQKRVPSQHDTSQKKDKEAANMASRASSAKRSSKRTHRRVISDSSIATSSSSNSGSTASSQDSETSLKQLPSLGRGQSLYDTPHQYSRETNLIDHVAEAFKATQYEYVPKAPKVSLLVVVKDTDDPLLEVLAEDLHIENTELQKTPYQLFEGPITLTGPSDPDKIFNTRKKSALSVESHILARCIAKQLKSREQNSKHFDAYGKELCESSRSFHGVPLSLIGRHVCSPLDPDVVLTQVELCVVSHRELLTTASRLSPNTVCIYSLPTRQLRRSPDESVQRIHDDLNFIASYGGSQIPIILVTSDPVPFETSRQVEKLLLRCSKTGPKIANNPVRGVPFFVLPTIHERLDPTRKHGEEWTALKSCLQQNLFFGGPPYPVTALALHLKLKEFQRDYKLFTMALSQVKYYLEEMFGEMECELVLQTLHCAGDIVYKEGHNCILLAPDEIHRCMQKLRQEATAHVMDVPYRGIVSKKALTTKLPEAYKNADALLYFLELLQLVVPIRYANEDEGYFMVPSILQFYREPNLSDLFQGEHQVYIDWHGNLPWTLATSVLGELTKVYKGSTCLVSDVQAINTEYEFEWAITMRVGQALSHIAVKLCNKRPDEFIHHLHKILQKCLPKGFKGEYHIGPKCPLDESHMEGTPRPNGIHVVDVMGTDEPICCGRALHLEPSVAPWMTSLYKKTFGRGMVLEYKITESTCIQNLPVSLMKLVCRSLDTSGPEASPEALAGMLGYTFRDAHFRDAEAFFEDWYTRDKEQATFGKLLDVLDGAPGNLHQFCGIHILQRINQWLGENGFPEARRVIKARCHEPKDTQLTVPCDERGYKEDALDSEDALPLPTTHPHGHPQENTDTEEEEEMELKKLGSFMH